MTLLSDDTRFMRIYAPIPWRGGIKRQWGCQEQQFSAILLVVSSETLEMRPALLYSDTQSVVGFSVIPKCVISNGYFALNYVFAPVCLASDCATFENNCVKTNKDRHILSAPQIFGRKSSFWQYNVYSGYSYGFSVTTVGSRVSRRAILSHEVYSLCA